jgi:lysyl-tRNA synthetase class 2
MSETAVAMSERDDTATEELPKDEQPGEGRLEEAIAARREKLGRLRARGIEPFALRFDRDASLAEVRTRFPHLAPNAETGERVRVAGRIMLLRRHGVIAFATIRDGTGDLQLFLTEEALGPGYELVDDLDLGDIVGAAGEVVATRRGELSVRAAELTLLSKALRPMPEKFHGLRDPEARFRRRYLDFATNPESVEVIRTKARALKAVRAALDERGFVEVETPVLQPMASGALARPFVTHHGALDADMYLRIAPELYLKRLLVGGMERIYEIGRNFRNEGIDKVHMPEFTMLEIYQAFGDYEDMMRLAQDVIRAAALETRGSLVFDYQGRRLDLGSEWRRLPLVDAISEVTGVDVGSLEPEALRAAAGAVHLDVSPNASAIELVKELYDRVVDKAIFPPTFVLDFPREISPLARPHRSKPGLTEQFDLVIAGMEIGPAYSELTDPDEQRARFELQAGARAAGDDEAHPYDTDFLEALEHGMPPAGGIGIGIDRVTMILADAPSIRDTITFPHLRPGPEG